MSPEHVSPPLGVYSLREWLGHRGCCSLKLCPIAGPYVSRTRFSDTPADPVPQNMQLLATRLLRRFTSAGRERRYLSPATLQRDVELLAGACLGRGRSFQSGAVQCCSWELSWGGGALWPLAQPLALPHFLTGPHFDCGMCRAPLLPMNKQGYISMV